MDREHEAVQVAADGLLGWRPAEPPASADGAPITVLRGETVPSGDPHRSADGEKLFGTMSDNAVTGRRSSHAEVALKSTSIDAVRFVAGATRRIARGTDLDEIVMGLCRATVPTFSDAILVYLRDPLPVGDERPTGPTVLRAVRFDGVRFDPVDDAQPFGWPEQRVQLPASAEVCVVSPGSGLAEALLGVRPRLGDNAVGRSALNDLLGTDVATGLGRRAIVAPMRGRRRVVGAIVLIRRPERSAFGTDDLLVAAQLATHSALGIDKAVLYGREAYIADELQRTMLPETLLRPTGLRLASRYLPAAETARVGGDWYDAIPLPGSRVALVVGDVMGHSMTSAAIMGQLRTTAQTLAGLDLPPQ
ncbi:PP2C family protein-serine/threonine phosphatase, partial [Streptomyces sp. NPDC001135]